MGIVVRPARFSAPKRAASARPRRRGIDGGILGLAVAGFGLACILALAGTAFAVRAGLALFFAALAAVAGKPRSAAR